MKVVRKLIYDYPQELSRQWKDLTFRPIRDLKLSIELDDGNIIECAVFKIEKEGIPEEHICISTQVGCKFRCKFCTSGQNGFVRNLSRKEIYKEIELLAKEEGIKKFDCIVFMGIGEPLDNFEEVKEVIKSLLKDKKLYNGKGNIAIATNGGMTKQLKKLSKLNLPVELWISLHSVDNTKRNMIMPINKSVPIEEVISSAENYAEKTQTTVWLNYMVFPGFNDTNDDIKKLASILEGKVGKLSLILTEPNRDIEGYKKAKYEDVLAFEKKLKDAGIKNEIVRFVTAGKTVGAGCGEFIFTKSSTSKKNALKPDNRMIF